MGPGLQPAPPGNEADALKQILEAWSGRSDRLAGPLAWLQSLPPDWLPANATEIFARAGFPVDPVPALQVWLALQPAGEVSQEVLTRFGQYLSSAPEGTLFPALPQEAGFPAERSARLPNTSGLSND